ncbi:uncharacterized protein CIMG_05930 [Coccidioides immitis RS]|uniref:Copper-fist domain-containing protein n=3 Tax=Coccidioides TaxID=5500 RepID=A0A0E1S1L4_COCIM|nr:uncharacterized protein CIMG_05930 [Coccidioides immitis RS]EAS30451.2 hypothetical protein CIMG_05930 [Coccidioides immitis RS]KMU77447.1 hypothetical protein CISG_06694 [Coccidioides immitis RMSCC 3703]TPX23413.1 hypothetical protein DIZ76_012744 [Coccidioides immitis]
MPLDEEGAKWSCEPCIRGHRSSKCQHFDRLMMKVPKAGRPLAKCPHPKGTCSCQKVYAFMVRIPKGSTCLCRPLYRVPMTGQPSGKVSPKSSPPLSVASSSTTSQPNRVQKRTRRQNSIQSQSDVIANGLTALAEDSEKPNLENVKPITPYTNMRSPIAPLQCHVPTIPSEAYHQSLAAPRINKLQMALPVQVPSPYNTSPSNFAQGSSPTHALTSPTPLCPAPCCERVTKSEGTSVNAGSTFVHTSPQETRLYTFSGPDPSSIFRRSSGAPKVESSGSLMHHNSNASLVSMDQFSAPFSLANPPYRNSYPSQSHIGSVHFAQGVPSSPANPFPHNYFGFESQPEHNCGCGDGCQCLGCASHPFNDTTRQHIQEMGYLMTLQSNEEGDNRPTSSYGRNDFSTHLEAYNPPQHPSGQSNIPGSFTGDFMSQSIQPLANEASLPTHGIYSQQNYEPLMQPGAYYTLEYPVGLSDFAPCTNIMGTCQCGINCKCIGCLTHDGHNGVSLEPSPPPDRPSGNVTSTTDKPVPQTQHRMELQPESFGLNHLKTEPTIMD